MLWSAMSSHGEGGCEVCVSVLGVSGFTGLVFFFFVSFLVRGSGLSTSFCVTSLYVDAAPQGGARHT